MFRLKAWWQVIVGALGLALIMLAVYLFMAPQDPVFERDDIILSVDDQLLDRSVQEALWPGFSVEYIKSGKLLEHLRDHPIVTFDTLAVATLEHNPDYFWYPEHLATIGYAVNTETLTGDFDSWNDLKQLDPARVKLGYSPAEPRRRFLYGAIVHGISGNLDNRQPTLEFLRRFAAHGNLIETPEEADIWLAFDDKVAEANARDPKWRFVLPREGGLTVEVGILSPVPLEPADDFTAVLAATGLAPSLAERADAALAGGPSRLLRISELGSQRFLKSTESVVRELRSEVYRTRRFGTKDHRQHVLFALLMVLVILLWSMRLITQLYERRMTVALSLIVLLLLGWILARMLKYSTDDPELQLLLWWMYFVFQLVIPLVMLWVSFMLDSKRERPPLIWYICIGLNAPMKLLALTNRWHEQVIDLHYDAGGVLLDEYSYNWGFYVILVLALSQTLLALVILALKNRRGPRPWAAAVPVVMVVLMFAYGWGYYRRIPIFWETDYTLTMAFLILLYLEAMFWGGLLPIHRGHYKFFELSTLNMQIVEPDGQLALAAENAEPLSGAFWERLREDDFAPRLRTEKALVQALPITGGYFLWEEDLTELLAQEAAIRRRGEELRIATALLREERNVKEELASLNLRNDLMTGIQNEVRIKQLELQERIDNFPEEPDPELATARIAILLCYLKRRCNFFFHQLEVSTLAAEELRVYMEELAELSGIANLDVVYFSQLTEELPVAHAALAYDFLHAFMAEASERAAPGERVRVLAQMVPTTGGFALQLLLPFALDMTVCLGNQLGENIAAAGGAVEHRDLDELHGYRLVFGEADDD